MAKNKKDEVILTTPKGVAKWARLNVPQREITSQGQTKPVTPNYQVTLLLDPNDESTVKLVDMLNKAHDEGFAQAKKDNPKKKLTKMDLKVGDDTDKEGTPTGKLAVFFKCKAEGERKDKTKWTFRPAIKDAKGNPVPSDVLIYSGSIIRVAYTIRHNAMPTGAFYTTLNLKAVQIINLKAQSDRDAAFYGFQSEEGYGSDESEGEEVEAGESYTAGESSAEVKSGADF